MTRANEIGGLIVSWLDLNDTVKGTNSKKCAELFIEHVQSALQVLVAKAFYIEIIKYPAEDK